MKNQSFEVICDDALVALDGVPDESFDALVMDPPYCSGGITPAATQSGGMRKYVDTVSKGSFADSMSQIALYDFLRLVVVRGLRKLKSPGYVFIFTDWRMLPVMASAMQGGGAIWRGLLTWNKGNSRPNPGQFSQTSEFITWGTKDQQKTVKFVVNSVFSIAADAAVKRVHPTQKPVALYRELFKILPDNPRILDIFMGSAPAGVATLDADGEYVGVDNQETYCERAKERLADTTAKLF